MAPRWRLREGGRVNPVEAERRRRGAWERVARPECEISRSGTSLLRRRLRGSPPDSYHTPCSWQGPAEPKLCPAKPQMQPCRSPALPPRRAERGAAAGTRVANGAFLIYFSHGNLSLWLGCPFTFRSRLAGDPVRREGAGGAPAQGEMETGEGMGIRAGREPRGKWA